MPCACSLLPVHGGLTPIRVKGSEHLSQRGISTDCGARLVPVLMKLALAATLPVPPVTPFWNPQFIL